MMFVKLTTWHDGGEDPIPTFINMDYIKYFYYQEGKKRSVLVEPDDSNVYVRETPEQILEMMRP